MNTPTRIRLALLLVAGLAHPTQSGERTLTRPDHHLRVAQAGAGRAARDSFSFVVEAPKVSVTPAADGFAEVRAEGFDARQTRAGYPNLPHRVILIAIPPDATPRLVFRPQGPAQRVAARPRPVPRTVPVPAGAVDAFETAAEAEQRLSVLPEAPTTEVPAFEPTVYEGTNPWPAAAAWLGRVGTLRDQRYVELHLAPVSFEGAAGSLIIEPALEVTVYFDGAARAGGREADASRFESVYRNAFVNYAQGRQFRLGHEEAFSGSAGEPVATSSIGPTYRIVTHQDGVVRLDYSLILARAPALLTFNPAQWRLVGRGSAVPLQIQQGGGNPALLEPGEWVQFYGERADDEAPSTLHWQGEIDQEALYEVQDFTDDDTYFLTVDSLVQPVMSSKDATPTGATPQSSFTAMGRVETDDQFWPLAGALSFILPPIYEAAPTLIKSVSLPGLASGTLPAQVRAKVRGLSSCLAVTPDHITRVSLKNNSSQTLILPASNPDNVGNQNVGQFDGSTLFTHDFGWVHTGANPQLTDPLQVTVQVDVLPGNCGTVVNGLTNDVYVDWIEVDYARSFAAQGDTLTFDWPDGDAEFQITGFTTSSPVIYEVTKLLPGGPLHDAVRLTGATVTPAGPNFTVRFHMNNDLSLTDGTSRRFVVAGSSGVVAPAVADFKAARTSTLMSDTSQADLVAIVHPDLVSSHCSTGGNVCTYDVDCTGGAADRCAVDAGSQLGLLLAHRQAQGLTTRVARIGDVYDEFGGGMPGPGAVKNFLSWVWSGGWNGPAPSYVMLVGDGSIDFKSGTTKGNFVPTRLMIKEGNPLLPYYSTDNLLAAVAGGDSLPEMVVGRVAVRTLSEAESVFQKILAYEQAPPSGAWKNTVMVVSDRGKLDGPSHPDAYESAQFEAINDLGLSFLADTPYRMARLRYWSDYCPNQMTPCNAAGIKGDIKAMVNGTGKTCTQSLKKCTTNADCLLGAGDTCNPIDGAALLQYSGHGNFDLWSDDKFFCGNDTTLFCTPDDTTQLFNGGRTPWMIVNNCLSGGFHSTSAKSFGEQWVKRVGGGAVGVFAPSGLGFQYLGLAVTQLAWGDMFGPQKVRDVATPVLDSLVFLCTGEATPEGCEFYTLLGDPATRLQLPDVKPAANLTAVASTGPTAQVSLSWSASSQPGVGYNVYRATQLNSPYVKLTPTPILATNYVDTAVIHTQDFSYYYYVVAVNAGFESAWSNFNSDCQAMSPIDCAKAQPLNLVPPNTPGAPLVEDAESGGKLLVSWTPNPESDVSTYEVHFGTTPAMTEPVQTGYANVTFGLGGLQNGTTYYVAIRAVNTSGTHSALSPIVSGVPTQVLGVKSPGFISNLRLGKSGTDALLTWSAVTTDIYGKSKAVSHYEVYRSTTMTFVPGPGTLRGTSAIPSFTDVGALGGAPAYFYLVRAIDADGNPGGLGQQLPDGVRDLLLGRLPNSNLTFTWTPVTQDFGGQPTVVVRYDLYSADHPFTRADIRDGLIPLVGSAIGNTIVLAPPSGSRYYSVLAVDTRGSLSPF